MFDIFLQHKRCFKLPIILVLCYDANLTIELPKYSLYVKIKKFFFIFLNISQIILALMHFSQSAVELSEKLI